MFKVGAFAIIVNEEKKVLLCHRRDYDLWNFPGGRVEERETPREAVIREVKEETGLDVQIQELLGIYSKPEENDIVFQFVCEICGGAISINDEADQIDFFDRKELPRNTVLKQVERLDDYFSGSPRPILKKQMGKSSIDLVKEGKL